MESHKVEDSRTVSVTLYDDIADRAGNLQSAEATGDRAFIDPYTVA